MLLLLHNIFFLLLALSIIAFLFSEGHALSHIQIKNNISFISKQAIGMSLKPYIEVLIEGERSLTASETEDAFDLILQGADEIQIGCLLMLLRARRESFQEIAGMIRAMKKHCKEVNLGEMKLLDIVGTGGDGADTINISTASSVLAAACGCTVAKAGNRSVSSKCGSADVLDALGVVVPLSPSQVVSCVQQCGIAFMFAPVNHPAMKHVAPVRKRLGIRSCFNILGPMINAASATRAVIGVFDPNLIRLVADALKEVALVEHVCIIHGAGLDEISPVGEATIMELKNTSPQGLPKEYTETLFSFDPLTVNIPRCQVEDLRGGSPEQNATEFKLVLEGGSQSNAKRDAVILNAALGCYVYGIVNNIENGVILARTTLEEGKAADKLKQWIQVSQEIKESS